LLVFFYIKFSIPANLHHFDNIPNLFATTQQFPVKLLRRGKKMFKTDVLLSRRISLG